MNFLFLMDPLDTVVMDKDTSFIFMWGAHQRGHKIFFVTDGDILLKDGELIFHALAVIPEKNAQNPFAQRTPVVLDQNKIDAVFVRNDPPFDPQYLLNTWLLDRLPKNIPVINSPHGLRTVNEKVWAAQFTQLVPPTLIGRKSAALLDFLSLHKDIVAKPTDGFGGVGVFHINLRDKNAQVILETLTQRWRKDVILQKYLPESQNGDKRILLLNGDVLGTIIRLHSQDDHRNNLFAGGTPMSAEITKRDLEIVSVLRPHLQRLGLYFVGIDIIGHCLIEVNVTSPTCLQEMNVLYNKTLEMDVIAFVEKLVHQHKNPDIPFEKFLEQNRSADIMVEKSLERTQESEKKPDAEKKQAPQMKHQLTLYHFLGCPFCARVRDYLAQNKIVIQTKDIRTNPHNREELIKISGSPQVPCLLIDGKPLYESDDIIQWFRDNWKRS